MQKIKNPMPIIRCIPYLVAVVLFIAVALLIPVFRKAAADGYLIEPSLVQNLLTYLPLASSLLLAAYAVSDRIFEKPKEKEKTGNIKSLAVLPVALSLICMVFGCGFASSYGYIKDNDVTVYGAFGSGPSHMVVTNKTPWTLTDDDVYVLRFSSGEVRIEKHSEAGKELEKTLFAQG